MGILDKARQKKTEARLKKGRKTENYQRKIKEYNRNRIEYVENVYKLINKKFSSEKRFVESLLTQIRVRGDLTMKQWTVLDKIKNQTEIKFDNNFKIEKSSKADTRSLIDKFLKQSQI